MAPTTISTAKNKHLTAVTKSETYHYEIKLIQADKQIPVNSSQLKAYPDDWNIASLSGTEYKNSTEAAKQMKNYQQVKQTNLDLGNGIKALQEGAAGHDYITWNEGRWYIRIDSPNDTSYSNSGAHGVKIAKSIVSYLHDHMLPPPHEHGVITIDNWKKHHSATVRYQDHAEIYTVTGHQEPLTPIEIAAALKPVS